MAADGQTGPINCTSNLTWRTPYRHLQYTLGNGSHVHLHLFSDYLYNSATLRQNPATILSEKTCFIMLWSWSLWLLKNCVLTRSSHTFYMCLHRCLSQKNASMAPPLQNCSTIQDLWCRRSCCKKVIDCLWGVLHWCYTLAMRSCVAEGPGLILIAWIFN